MHSRLGRRARVAIGLATVMAVLVAPIGASAHGGGSSAAFTVTAAPERVSAGQLVAFDVFIRSDGSSAFDKVKLQGAAPGATLVSAPSGCWGSGASVTCELGKLKSGSTLNLRFTFDTPDAAGSVAFTAKLLKKHYGWWSHHGSWKIAFTASDAAALIDDPDVFSTWQPAHGAPISYATEPIGGDNGQTSRLDIPPVATGYPATLAEDDDPIICKGKNVGGFGQAVELSVANGGTVSPHLTLTLTYTKAEVGYRDAYHIKFVHQTDDGTCLFPPRHCTWKNDGFCFDAWWTGHGHSKKLVIRVELPHNGRGKGL
jgi:hypothetical protein